MSPLNEFYVSPVLEKAIKDGANALRAQVRAIERDLEKQIADKTVLAGNGVIAACTQTCEDYLQAADILDGFVKRHGSPDQTRNPR